MPQPKHNDAQLTIFNEVVDLAEVEIVCNDDALFPLGQGYDFGISQLPWAFSNQAMALVP